MGAYDEYNDVPETGGGVSMPAPTTAPAAAPAVKAAGHPMDAYGDHDTSSTDAGVTAAAPKDKIDYGAMPLSTAAGEGLKTAIPASVEMGKGLLGAGKEALVNTINTGQIPGAGLAHAADAWASKNVPGASWINEKLGFKPPSDAEYEQTVKPLTDQFEQINKTWGSGYRMARSAADEKLKETLGPEAADKFNKAIGHTPLDPNSPEASGAGFKEALATNAPGLALDVASVVDPALRATRMGKAGKLAGAGRVAEPVTEAQLGQELHGAASASAGARDAAYAKTAAVQGGFDQSALMPIMQDATGAVSKEIGASNWNVLNTSPSLRNVKGAVDVLQAQLGNLNPTNFNMATLETIRRDLRTFADGASGTEKFIIGKMVDGFDKGVGRAATTPGMFTGNGAEAVSTMKEARKAHVSHLNNFGSNAPLPVRNAVKKLGDLAQAGDDEFHAAGSTLGAGLLNPGGGAALHSHVVKHIPEATVNDFAKERLLTGTQNAVNKNLANPVAKKAFGSDLTRAQKVNAQPQGGVTKLQRAAPYLKGAARAASVPIGFMHSGVTGALMGPLFEQGLERMFPSAAHAAPGSTWDRYRNIKPGAKPPMTPGQLVNPLTWLNPKTYAPLVKPSTYAPAMRPSMGAASRQNQLEQDREGHASGGAVKGHQHLVDRLFTAAERAKREEKAHTSSILHQPDEAVAKALNVAQQAI